MVVDIRLRLARNIIFTTTVGSLLTIKYKFSQLRLCHFISVTKIHFKQISIFARHPLWMV